MSPFLQLALILVIILLAAKLAGYVAIKLGQPSVLGEMVVGILLGPSLINLFNLPVVSDNVLGETISQLGQIGVLLLMFTAGLELHFHELRQNTQTSAFAGIMGALVSIILGWMVGLSFGLSQLQAIFLGITLAASSVSISAQTLMELKQLKSRVGLSLLGAAVFDDILVIFILSLFFALTGGSGSPAEILVVFGRMILFFAIAASFGLWILPRLVKWVRNLPVSQGVLSLAVVVALSYAIAAELVGGMATITGAFLAGLMFARSPEKEALEPRIHALAYGFFVPIFFVNIGLSVNIFSLKDALGQVLLVILAAVVGKLLGAGLGGRLSGLAWNESWQLGMGMVPRAEVSLIAASAGISAGLMGTREFSAVVGMVIVTTLITPPVLRLLFSPPKQRNDNGLLEGKRDNTPEIKENNS
jgi:Kef-type K+ transport system membrane component KefB